MSEMYFLNSQQSSRLSHTVLHTVLLLQAVRHSASLKISAPMSHFSPKRKEELAKNDNYSRPPQYMTEVN